MLREAVSLEERPSEVGSNATLHRAVELYSEFRSPKDCRIMMNLIHMRVDLLDSFQNIFLILACKGRGKSEPDKS